MDNSKLNTTYQSINLNQELQSHLATEQSFVDKQAPLSYTERLHKGKPQINNKLFIRHINKLRSIQSQNNMFSQRNKTSNNSLKRGIYITQQTEESNTLLEEENTDLRIKKLFSPNGQQQSHYASVAPKIDKDYSTLYQSPKRKMEFAKRRIVLRSLFQDESNIIEASHNQQQKDLTLVGKQKDTYQIETFNNRIIQNKLTQQTQRGSHSSCNVNLKVQISSTPKESFIDSIQKQGDFIPDALNPTTMYNSTQDEQDWKYSFKKFQKNHIPTVLPKIIAKSIGSSHYNLTSLNSHRLNTDSEPSLVETQHCFTQRSKGKEVNLISEIDETHLASQMFDRKIKHKKRISFIESRFNKRNIPNISDNVKPLVEYRSLKQQIHETFQQQIVASDKINENNEFYLSKKKFQKYHSDKKDKSTDKINSLQVNSNEKKQSGNKEASLQMLMQMKEQELKTLFESFRKISNQKSKY